jgi:hypothetical protein
MASHARRKHRFGRKQFLPATFWRVQDHPGQPRRCIFLLTFERNNLIYESHCDLSRSQILMLRENRSMKNATKKAAKKKVAKKKGK